MKKFIVLAVICVIAFVYLPITATGQKVDVTFSGLSKYVALIGKLPFDKPVAQANVFVPLSKGFYGDLWMSSGFDGKANFGREIDYQIGYFFPQGDTFQNVDFSLSYFDLNKLFATSGDVGDVIRPMIKYSETVQTIEGGEKKFTAIMEAHYFYVTKDTKNSSSFLIRYGGDFDSGPLGYGNLVIGALLVYDGGILGHENEGFMGDFHIDYPFPAGGLAKIIPTARLTLPFKNVEGKDMQFAFGLKIAM